MSLRIKTVFVGSPGQGKTCLLTKISSDTFHEQQVCTIGVQFRCRKFQVKGQTYTVQFWDTAGQQRFRSLSKTFYRSANIVVVCFNLNNQKSLQQVGAYIQQAKNNFVQADVKPHLFLMGCKRDLDTNVAVDMALQIAEKNGMTYWQTSAKSGQGVAQFVEEIKKILPSFQPLEKRRIDIMANQQLKVSTKPCSC